MIIMVEYIFLEFFINTKKQNVKTLVNNLGLFNTFLHWAHFFISARIYVWKTTTIFLI